MEAKHELFQLNFLGSTLLNYRCCLVFVGGPLDAVVKSVHGYGGSRKDLGKKGEFNAFNGLLQARQPDKSTEIAVAEVFENKD